MSTYQRLLSVLLASMLATACTATRTLDDPACANDPEVKTRHRMFKVDGNGCVVEVQKRNGTNGETVRAQRCDYVEWKITGKKKSIEFKSSAGSPFEWPDSGFKGSKISGQIRHDATETQYKYTVRTEGLDCDHDPMIIVQP